MTLLNEIKDIITNLNIPVETGVFSGAAPNRYVVFVPLIDTYELYSDNLPFSSVEEIRISLFDKGNYLLIKKQIESAILTAEITVTERKYLGYDFDSGYHHIAIDVAKNYKL